jgi:hypothetical protein
MNLYSKQIVSMDFCNNANIINMQPATKNTEVVVFEQLTALLEVIQAANASINSYVTLLGDGESIVLTVPHPLNSQALFAQVMELPSYTIVYPTTRVFVDTVIVDFNNLGFSENCPAVDQFVLLLFRINSEPSLADILPNDS